MNVLFDKRNKDYKRGPNSVIVAKPGSGRNFTINYKNLIIEEIIKRIKLIGKGKERL